LIFKIAGAGMIFVVLAMTFKSLNRDEMATIVALVGMITILAVVVKAVVSFFEAVRTMFQL
jgi:stage III sporulation protein AC